MSGTRHRSLVASVLAGSKARWLPRLPNWRACVTPPFELRASKRRKAHTLPISEYHQARTTGPAWPVWSFFSLSPFTVRNVKRSVPVLLLPYLPLPCYPSRLHHHRFQFSCHRPRPSFRSSRLAFPSVFSSWTGSPLTCTSAVAPYDTPRSGSFTRTLVCFPNRSFRSHVLIHRF